MKKSIVALLCLSVVSLSGYASAETAPDKWLELLRSDLRTQKVEVVTNAMDLSQKDGEKFWPLYREYELKLAKITDSRIATIKAYADNYDTMSNDKARELTKAALKINRQRFDLQSDYYGKISKATSKVVGARFLQIEAQVNNLVDLQIGLQLPLVSKLVPVTAPEKK